MVPAGVPLNLQKALEHLCEAWRLSGTAGGTEPGGSGHGEAGGTARASGGCPSSPFSFLLLFFLLNPNMKCKYLEIGESKRDETKFIGKRKTRATQQKVEIWKSVGGVIFYDF